jgi:methionyl-tRNA synthetase
MTDFETMPIGTRERLRELEKENERLNQQGAFFAAKSEELERKLFERNLSEIKRLVGNLAETLRYNKPWELVRLQQILKEIGE